MERGVVEQEHEVKRLNCEVNSLRADRDEVVFDIFLFFIRRRWRSVVLERLAVYNLAVQEIPGGGGAHGNDEVRS